MKTYKIVHGTCEICCFRKGVHGISLCKREENTECTPGITCYAEVPTTNGDRIRAMSNEDLAAYLNKLRTCPPGYGIWHCTSKNCLQCWLAWIDTAVETEGEPSK